MENEQQPTERSLPGKRWLFFVLLVGLWMMKSMGFKQVAVWVTSALGCLALLIVWLLSFSKRPSQKFVNMTWYLGLLLLLSAKLIGLIWPMAEVVE